MAPASSTSSRGPGVLTYVKHAFLYHWNLLLLVGATGLGVLSPWPDAVLPLVAGLELAYLTSLIAMPRFRTAIDAKVAAEARERSRDRSPDAPVQQSLERMLDSLPAPSLQRFVTLRQRCFEMRDIASGVRGQTAGSGDSADSVRTPALDRLLFLFLKLLLSQAGLTRELSLRLEALQIQLKAAQTEQDERTIRSLQDSIADATLRLDNYKKSVKDAEFVGVELDRIETKIQALTEMGVSRQDPDTISHQVTAAAESMQQTEDAVNQLQHLTGLADQLAEPPAILEADLDRVMTRGR
jgi:hypothetical protein